MDTISVSDLSKKEKDLAEGMFFAKWPRWIRWLLFLPSAIFVPILFFAFQYLMQTWFLDMGEDAFLLVIMRGVIYGAGFIWVGTVVSPNNQKVVSLILMIFASMVIGIGMFAAYINQSSFMNYIEALIMLAAAGYSTYQIFTDV